MSSKTQDQHRDYLWILNDAKTEKNQERIRRHVRLDSRRRKQQRAAEILRPVRPLPIKIYEEKDKVEVTVPTNLPFCRPDAVPNSSVKATNTIQCFNQVQVNDESNFIPTSTESILQRNGRRPQYIARNEQTLQPREMLPGNDCQPTILPPIPTSNFQATTEEWPSDLTFAEPIDCFQPIAYSSSSFDTNTNAFEKQVLLQTRDLAFSWPVTSLIATSPTSASLMIPSFAEPHAGNIVDEISFTPDLWQNQFGHLLSLQMDEQSDAFATMAEQDIDSEQNPMPDSWQLWRQLDTLF